MKTPDRTGLLSFVDDQPSIIARTRKPDNQAQGVRVELSERDSLPLAIYNVNDQRVYTVSGIR